MRHVRCGHIWSLYRILMTCHVPLILAVGLQTFPDISHAESHCQAENWSEKVEPYKRYTTVRFTLSALYILDEVLVTLYQAPYISCGWDISMKSTSFNCIILSKSIKQQLFSPRNVLFADTIECAFHLHLSRSNYVTPCSALTISNMQLSFCLTSS